MLTKEVQRLNERLRSMPGLVDARFDLDRSAISDSAAKRNLDGSALSEVAVGEVHAMLDACERGEETPFAFNDSRSARVP